MGFFSLCVCVRARVVSPLGITVSMYVRARVVTGISSTIPKVSCTVYMQ